MFGGGYKLNIMYLTIIAILIGIVLAVAAKQFMESYVHWIFGIGAILVSALISELFKPSNVDYEFTEKSIISGIITLISFIITLNIN
jgi:hypothetical protein